MRKRLASTAYISVLAILLLALVVQNTSYDRWLALQDLIYKVNLNNILPNSTPKEPFEVVHRIELPEQDPDLMTKSMVYPTVLWRTNSGSKASGVLIGKNNKVFVVTTRHSLINEEEVLQHLKSSPYGAKAVVDDTEYSIIAMVGEVKKKFDVKIQYVDISHDFLIAEVLEPYPLLAPGQMDIGIKFPLYVADIATPSEQDNLSFFEKIVVVGFPGSYNHPMISEGVISGMYQDGHIGVTAQIIPGNSGGPVYLKNTRHLIGIITSVYTIQGSPFGVQIVPHLSRMIPITEVVFAMEVFIK